MAMPEMVLCLRTDMENVIYMKKHICFFSPIIPYSY